MLRHYALRMTLLLFLVSSLAMAARAQSMDRARLEAELDSLREQLKLKEQEFLSPSIEDRTAFAAFLGQPETGLIRLLPREKYEQKLSLRGGGAYYSFSRLTHEYGFGSDIELSQNQLRVGFAGADFGFIALLGDVPLEAVTAETDGVQFLAALVAPSSEPEARSAQRRANAGVRRGEHLYQNSRPVQPDKTYVLRSISYRDSDTLIAFRIVRQDEDGSITLLWKRLKKYPTPHLTE